jgi:hypothetical protein
LRVGLIQTNDKAPLPGDVIKAGAHAFAERQARKAGLID